MHGRVGGVGRRALVLVGALAAFGAAATPARAQLAPGEPCLADVRSETAVIVTVPGSGDRNLFYGGGVDARCEGKNVRLLADSLEYYGATRTMFLIGNVRYTEPRVNMTANNVTYYMSEERVLATGNVNARMQNGSSMRGPQIEYWRQTPFRPRQRMLAPGRPRFSLVERDSSGREQPPVTVTGNTVLVDGDSLVYASGRVEIERTDMQATSDSLALDSGAEIVELRIGPRVQSRSGRPFTLTGVEIDVFTRQRQLSRVLAMDSAVATSEDLRLASDTIDLRINAQLLERAFVWGRSRARATSSAQDIVADSLDVYMPFQRLREVRAVRGARAEGEPDSVGFVSEERDWLRGDTVITRFVPPRPGRERDTTEALQLQEVVAVGDAAAFTQVAPQDTTLRRPAINYVTGGRITVAFDTGSVRTVTIEDQKSGIYLEPTADSTKRAADGMPQPRAPGAPRGTNAGQGTPGAPGTPGSPGSRLPLPVPGLPGGRRP